MRPPAIWWQKGILQGRMGAAEGLRHPVPRGLQTVLPLLQVSSASPVKYVREVDVPLWLWASPLTCHTYPKLLSFCSLSLAFSSHIVLQSSFVLICGSAQMPPSQRGGPTTLPN